MKFMPTFPFKLFIRWCVNALMLGGLAWALVQLFIDPKIQARQLLEEEMKRLDIQIQNDVRFFPDLEKLGSSTKKEMFYLNRLKKKAREFKNKLLGEKETAELLARDASLEQIYKAEQGDTVRQLLKVRGKASYEDVIQRLDRIESSSPFLVMRSIDIERTGDEGSGPLRWEFEVEETHSKSVGPDTLFRRTQAVNPEAVAELSRIRNPFVAG